MKINSHILQISGKVELPKELISGFNYKVTIEGSVPKIEMVDNENGTFDVVYKMKPIKVEVINEIGETLKAKDPRSNSVLARSQARAIHIERNLIMEADTFYDVLSARLRGITNDVVDQLIKEGKVS